MKTTSNVFAACTLTVMMTSCFTVGQSAYSINEQRVTPADILGRVSMQNEIMKIGPRDDPDQKIAGQVLKTLTARAEEKYGAGVKVVNIRISKEEEKGDYAVTFASLLVNATGDVIK